MRTPSQATRRELLTRLAKLPLFAGLDAASLSGNEASFRSLLSSAGSTELPALPLAKMLAQLLRSRIGNDAADRWQDAYLRANAPR